MALDLSGRTGPPRPGSQILVWCRREKPELLVAGLPLSRRAVYTACRAGFERLLVIADGSAESLRAELRDDDHLAGRYWEVASAAEGWVERVRSSEGRWVVLCADWVLDAELLKDLSESSGAPAAASVDGPLAADAQDIARWAESGWNPAGLPVVPLRPSVAKPSIYVRVSSAAEVRAAEDRLFESLARNAENFFARNVDRAMSRAISRRLSRTRVTPNQITIFSIGVGIAGALLLLHPSYLAGLIGSLLFFASTVIDGCDGEIARLKFRESASGAKLDVIGDNVVHAFLFPCVALRFYFIDPSGPFFTLGLVSLAGVVASWLAVYFLILRSNPSPRAVELFELFANREFAYLFLVLGIIGRLDWFVWAMAFGLWIFPVGLVALSGWERLAERGR